MRFVLLPETKAKGIFGDPILSVENSGEGIVLDGFVFDGSTYNSYADSGALDAGHSQSAALVDLRGGAGGVTVRNCVFANAAYCAVQLGGAYGVFENNVVVNTSGTAIRLAVTGAGPWVVHGNTVLFAADPTGRASTGQSTSGCLLDISGQGVVRVSSTVLAFADSIAVRAAVPGQNLVLDGNVLAANLYADVFDGRNVLIDAVNRERVLLDAPFGGQSGTRYELPALPVDPAFAGEAVGRLSALAAAMPKDALEAAAAALGVSLAAPASETAPPADGGIHGPRRGVGHRPPGGPRPRQGGVRGRGCSSRPVGGPALLPRVSGDGGAAAGRGVAARRAGCARHPARRDVARRATRALGSGGGRDLPGIMRP